MEMFLFPFFLLFLFLIWTWAVLGWMIIPTVAYIYSSHHHFLAALIGLTVWWGGLSAIFSAEHISASCRNLKRIYWNGDR